MLSVSAGVFIADEQLFQEGQFIYKAMARLSVLYFELQVPLLVFLKVAASVQGLMFHFLHVSPPATEFRRLVQNRL